jgi:hypothetical protein
MLHRRLFILVAASAFAACSDATAPMQRLSGTYEASQSAGPSPSGTFTTTEGGVTTDWLAQGAEVRLTLRPDGTTAGRLFIPDVNADREPEQGANFEQDLAGTWSVSGNVVVLDHDADTFLRNMSFHVRGSRLEGQKVFGDVTVNLVLVRTS